MSQSSFGKKFVVTTWGRISWQGYRCRSRRLSPGLSLCEEDIQVFLDRRNPGQSRYTTARKEGDLVEILSGVFEGKTTGTPISLLIRNTDQRSRITEILHTPIVPVTQTLPLTRNTVSVITVEADALPEEKPPDVWQPVPLPSSCK